jgi:hypothetical protein
MQGEICAGTLTWTDGVVFQGEYKNDARNGPGRAERQWGEVGRRGWSEVGGSMSGMVSGRAGSNPGDGEASLAWGWRSRPADANSMG